MDPHTGRLYESIEDAKADGVENPVELVGRLEDVQRISAAVRSAVQSKARVMARKQQKASRKANR